MTSASRSKGEDGQKFVAAGTAIMRRADVMGIIHKSIAQAHDEARQLGENGSLAAFSAVRHKIAAYMALRSELRAMPVFVNEAPADLAAHLTDQEGQNR